MLLSKMKNRFHYALSFFDLHLFDLEEIIFFFAKERKLAYSKFIALTCLTERSLLKEIVKDGR